MFVLGSRQVRTDVGLGNGVGRSAPNFIRLVFSGFRFFSTGGWGGRFPGARVPEDLAKFFPGGGRAFFADQVFDIVFRHSFQYLDALGRR